MKEVKCEININGHVIDQVKNISINSDRKTLSDTCEIEFPRKLSWYNQHMTKSGDLFKIGSIVTVKLGYDDNIVKRFDGFLTKVDTNDLLKISLEDGMYLAKLFYIKPFTAGETDSNGEPIEVPLSSVFKKMLPVNITLDSGVFPDIRIKHLRINARNAYEVFEFLKKEFSLDIYFRDGKLKVEVLPNFYDTHAVDFSRHVVSHNLESKNSTDFPLTIRVTGIDHKNNNFTFDIGKGEGKIINIDTHNQNIKQLADRIYKEFLNFQFDGLSGDLTIVGEPFIQHGDIIHMSDEETQEHNGEFLINSVKTVFDMQSGIRQTLEIGRDIKFKPFYEIQQIAQLAQLAFDANEKLKEGYHKLKI
ncbi:hypothetical protein [Aureibacter tunicatorum]|uniref:Phage protein D n=1 Tax=Aureibacter tunicatorum TaxID=866807 RepID=A0AAE4BVH8_9BACT|nr:hypothetical protein [Aureibacter tunicatorum]MDR6241887.1 hypothetical protein [Aureibacter tunicatorum]BDD07494.1 hypothetical protein AUTU_49770 [Aureibacter tunicatorum]